mgnify:CR=1 FL=1
MQKIHAITPQSGMFNRATKSKIEKGIEATIEDKAQRAKIVKETIKPKGG